MPKGTCEKIAGGQIEAFCDWLPHDHCRVVLDPALQDRWHLADKGAQVLKKPGAGEVISYAVGNPPTNLQTGGCRFGRDPATSVLDPDCRAHDCENLFVADDSFMPTGERVPHLDHLRQRLPGSRPDGSPARPCLRRIPCLIDCVPAHLTANRILGLAAPLVDLGLRVYVAHIFFKSGLVKLQSRDSTLALFEYEYAVPLLPPDIAAYLGTAAELALPALVALGLLRMEFQSCLSRREADGAHLLQRVYYQAGSLDTLREAMYASKYFDARDGAFKLVYYPAMGQTAPAGK